MVVVKEIQAETVDLVEDHLTAPLVEQEMELLDKEMMVVALLVQLVEAEAEVKVLLVQLHLVMLVEMEAPLYPIPTAEALSIMAVAAVVEVVITLLEVMVVVMLDLVVRPQEQMLPLGQQTEVVAEVAEVVTALETVPIKMVPLVDLEL